MAVFLYYRCPLKAKTQIPNLCKIEVWLLPICLQALLCPYTGGSNLEEVSTKCSADTDSFRDAMKEANLPDSEFHTEEIFTVVFKWQNINIASHDTVNGMVKGNEQAIINFLAARMLRK